MSYMLTIGGPADALEEAFVDAVNDAIGREPDAGRRATMADHLDAAGTALAALTRVVGLPGEHLAVTVSGHSNPGHMPSEGWADEAVTVSVIRMFEQPE